MNTALENEELKQRRQALRKRVPSKLDAFTEPLRQMEAEKKTIDQMLAWLQERGVTTARSNLSHFLKRQREAAGRQELRERLTAKANKLNEVEEWLAKNPKPDPGMVLDIFKMQVMELAAEAGMEPQRLKLADRLTRTAMGFVNDQSRETYRTRRLAMEEAKQAERVKRGRTRIATSGLGQVKKRPTMAELFRKAFDVPGERRKEEGK